jgi:peptidoglycan/LPS O-acetylase OafA/YrhL
MKLIEVANGKDNNFNLLRLFAAFAVLVTHSFAIVTGDPQSEPLRAWIGMTIGDFAVDAFFITSGFLVTASLERKQSVRHFIFSRALRIYPALLVMLVCTVFAMGLLVTSLDTIKYLSSTQTYKYFIKCAFLIFNIEYVLPGVFELNPVKLAVNGSLWSMPWELRMYALLLSIWIFAKVFGLSGLVFLKRSVLFIFLAALALHIGFNYGASNTNHGIRLFYMFFSGAALYCFRDKIPLSNSLIAIGLSLLFASSTNKDIFFVIYTLVYSYLILWLAYIPSGTIRKYNYFGDYSYGTYIYAYPIQQLAIKFFPALSVVGMIFFSTLLTLIFAAGSWHFVEERALNLKRNF